jgi:hypothetical protein
MYGSRCSLSSLSTGLRISGDPDPAPSPAATTAATAAAATRPPRATRLSVATARFFFSCLSSAWSPSPSLPEAPVKRRFLPEPVGCEPGTRCEPRFVRGVPPGLECALCPGPRSTFDLDSSVGTADFDALAIASFNHVESLQVQNGSYMQVVRLASTLIIIEI